jgi:hypothetical protein
MTHSNLQNRLHFYMYIRCEMRKNVEQHPNLVRYVKRILASQFSVVAKPGKREKLYIVYVCMSLKYTEIILIIVILNYVLKQRHRNNLAAVCLQRGTCQYRRHWLYLRRQLYYVLLNEFVFFVL